MRKSKTVVMMATLVVWMGLVAGWAVVAGAGSVGLVVYSDAVQRPWNVADYSWDASVNYAAAPAGTGKRAIKVSLKGWGGLAAHTNSHLPVVGVATLRFQVRGASGGEALRVALYDGNGSELPAHGGVQLAPYVNGRLGTTWQNVTIPVSKFASAGAISKVAIISDSAAPQTVYLDEIRFVAR